MKGARHKRCITGQLCSTPHRRLVTARAPPPVAGFHPPAGCAAPFVLSWHLRRWSTSHGPAPTGRPPAPSSLDPRRRASRESCRWKHALVGLDLRHRARSSRIAYRLHRHRARQVFAVKICNEL